MWGRTPTSSHASDWEVACRPLPRQEERSKVSYCLCVNVCRWASLQTSGTSVPMSLWSRYAPFACKAMASLPSCYACMVSLAYVVCAYMHRSLT